MADNFTVEPVTGTPTKTFASDDISGVDWPYAKLAFGPRDTANEVEDADGKRLPIKPHMAASATRTAVNDSSTAVTILAANANRKGAYILNTSSALLYLGLGATDPTSTDFTEQLFQGQSWRVPDCYTGIIKGIWATDPNDGVARVTEMS
jgi:hypothetical protein